MNISRLFVLRPVATSLLMIALVLVGLVAVRFLPISSLPDIEYPTIQVKTFYPGASPQVMATTVTAPLEVQLGEIPSLTQMTSASSAGASIINLQFNLALNLDVAEQNVQEAINAANSLLPTGLPAPPIYAKVNPADQPILTLAVTSKSMSLTQLQDVANNRLASKISEVPGVGLVSPAGGNVPAVRVEADPHRLAGYGLNIDDLHLHRLRQARQELGQLLLDLIDRGDHVRPRLAHHIEHDRGRVVVPRTLFDVLRGLGDLGDVP